MKHIVVAITFLVATFCSTMAFGQTPEKPKPVVPYSYAPSPRPAATCWWWQDCRVYTPRNPNLSPTTKRKLYEHDPGVCHCDECRRMRLAAGIEYMGLDKPGVHVPPPPRVYTPITPYEPYVYCSGVGVVRKSLCPGRQAR